MSLFSKDDEHWMRVALEIGRRHSGTVAPNPAVGCVIVNNGIVVGRGWTQTGGRPHAETVALAQAGNNANGATAYVTLEPCAHTGKSPPCADALIAAKLKRVVVATLDPDKRVNGLGISKLLAAGIKVNTGLLKENADREHRGFFLTKYEMRPRFTLKLATSKDGKIAKANGDSKWITGIRARQMGHMMRAHHDAILVGVGTVVADNPSLTCRIDGLQHRNPVRIVLDTNLRTPVDCALVKTAKDVKTIIFTESDTGHETYERHNVIVIKLLSMRDMPALAQKIASLGITSVLIEGGASVAASFMKANLIDDCAVFTAPTNIGEGGINAISGIELASILTAPHFILNGTRKIGPDFLATYQKAE